MRPMKLTAGAAVRDITPKKPLFLAGYPRAPRMAAGTHDPLLASALYLHDGATPLLLIGVDILFVSRQSADFCRAAIRQAAGIPAGNIMITATHTHSGPVTNDELAWRDDPVVPPPDAEYMREFHAGIIQAGVAACAAAQPAELAVTAARAEGVGRNRIDPDGPFDSEVGLLAVRRADDHQLFALDIIYGMHPTVLHEDSTQVSADFPHFVRRRIAAAVPGIACVYHTAPCGNLSPRYDVRGQTFSEAERLSGRLGEAIMRAVDGLAAGDYRADVSLAAAVRRVSLVPNSFPTVAEAAARLRAAVAKHAGLAAQNAPHGVVRTAECEAFGAGNALTLARLQATGEMARRQRELGEAEVQVFRIGAVFLVGLPGEQFVEYALELKRQAPARAFVVSLCNGELQGYIVTPAAAAAGGYEAAWAMFHPESGARLVSAALAMMRGMA